MYTFQQKAEVTQISLTGARLIVILGALMLQPRSIDELNALVTDCGLVDKNYSKDTIRIALSTLKAIGCVISRPCKTSDFKYRLVSHPFALEITDLELQALKTVYTNLTRGANYKTAIRFNSFLNKLAAQVCDEDVAARLKDITAFKRIDKDVYEALVAQDGKHNKMTLSYSHPSSGKVSQYNIAFGSILLKSNKLYIEGTDLATDKNIVLNMARIVSVDNVEDAKGSYHSEACKIKYLLKDFSRQAISENQKVSKVTDDEAVVEAEFTNEFFAIQHILSLGSDCTVLEPESIRAEVIKKLTGLRRIYE